MHEHKEGRVTTDTRERILREASQLYLAGSYEAVSMQIIADHLNISKATIFHHFTNKQELFFEMWLLNVKHFHQRLQNAVARPEIVSVQAQLRSILQCLAQTSGFDMSRMAQDVVAFLSPKQQEELRRSWRASFTLITQVLETGIERGELKPHHTQLAAYTLLHLGRLLPTSAHPRPFLLASLSQESALDALLDMVLNGLKMGRELPARTEAAAELPFFS